MNITHSECVFVALCIQHFMCMLRIILYSVACLVLQYFSTLSYKRDNFRKKDFEHKMCVLIVDTNLSETFLILRRNEKDMIKNVH